MFDEAIKGMNEETNNGIVAVGREKKTYTVEEIQNILEISRASAYRLAHSNQFRVLKIGGQLRIPVVDFEAWLGGSAVLSNV